PFTPYFALLGNIISDPQSSECLSDLQLLRGCISYFERMNKIYQHVSKLR
ncbi:hypothetical protein OIDMADRAFT_132172, partial [Oidiodendron maius Zn]